MSIFDGLASEMIRWRKEPPRMVRELFGTVPDSWQDQVLADFPNCRRQALKACKGPGKTATMAWLGWNFLATRPDPKCVATSNSRDNLRDNLWTEMAKWQAKSDILTAGFQWGHERIVARHRPETWWMSARSWSQSADKQQQASTLAGFHSDYMLFLCDETGDYPEAVMATAEAALATGIEVHVVQAGNPTRLEGPLYRASTTDRKLWACYEITGDPDDPNRASRVSIEWAREQIAQYGKDHPYVLVNVFGRFPPASLNVLLGPDEITAAEGRHYREDVYAHAARIISADVARFGDDQNVICRRQGLVTFPFSAYRNISTLQGAGLLARQFSDWDADAIFVDDTGGYGGGWIDGLRAMGLNPIPVQYAGEPFDPRYANKRAEMYFAAAGWVKEGGALPVCPELRAALTTTTYTFKTGTDKFIIEPKALVKARLGYSPDHADAFIQTFAAPVTAKARTAEQVMIQTAQRAMSGRSHDAGGDPFEAFRSGRR